MNAPTPTLAFPTPVLTPVIGVPNLQSIRTLRRELYANARAIPTTLGGGANGHLALIMPDADYLARAGVAFPAPAHPGGLPAHAAAATTAQITQTNRTYDATLAACGLYTTVREELKKQLLAAVDHKYLKQLEDDVFGYADVTPQAMLVHLQTTYGAVTQDDIEKNRNLLSAPWNPDDSIEDLWTRILHCQSYATAAQEPIPDAAAIRLILNVLEKTGIFTDALAVWRRKPEADHTLANFKAHFTAENKERVRVLTAQTAGFHGANAASGMQPSTTPPGPTPTLIAAATATSSASLASTVTSGSVLTNDTVSMYYCWSHGLGKNAAHTSATCLNKKEGHKTDATADNMKGGNNTIMSGRAPRRTNPSS